MNLTLFDSARSCCQTMLIDVVRSKFFKQLALLLVISAVLSLQVVRSDAGSPSAGGFQPQEFAGNPTCSEFFNNEDLRELKVEPVYDGTYSDYDGELSVTLDVQKGAKTLSWDQGDSAVIMLGVFVKGGPGGNLYNYMGSFTSSDAGLHAPEKASNKFYGLSHISFCYIPGKPELKVNLTCEGGTLVDGGSAIKYDYLLKVENTGSLQLFDIVAKTDVSDEEFIKGTLAVGESKTFDSSFITDINGISGSAEAKAAVESGGTVIAGDSNEFDCPVETFPGKLNVTKECSTVVVQNGYGDYGLQVNYGGDVCNDSNVLIKDIVVEETHGNMTEVIHMVDVLAPGACEDYSGNYVPLPELNELPEEGVSGDMVRAFVDTVKATGDTFFGEAVESMEAEASCKLCPDCPECPQP
ncbi:MULTISPECIES: hypothetical protein [unclassified Shewanella]|uniref:hypothetical protein n=1 Tax=unclassified Shewanella TaxID=196818 RepID=UPI001BC5C921|nr:MULTISPECIES: hypothetical protein [unclassified Shewanella]GIU10277.1 hypothetical protein TUM4444_14280 [Shewanella sp. MBTL60-112-B1]GIU32502.1 hypothetical protein TUM4445_18270 [Shewanella sp. MBTL60-112-B2]